MGTTPLHKPLLPGHYSLWFDPPDDAGDEALHIVSDRRSLKLKGKAFREFKTAVVPLLNGRHTVEQIQVATRELFEPEDLAACLDLLTDQGVLVDAAGIESHGPVADRMAPQLNFFHDFAPGVDLQARLSAATVAVIGLTGAGPSVALALAAAGVGTVRCVDPLSVTPTDVYLSPFLQLDQVGSGRAAAVTRALGAAAPETRAIADGGALETEADVQRAIAGASVVVCCLDPGLSNLVFKLNRVCLALNIRWIACAPSGPEVVVGPAIHPWRTACYLCYRMRAIACAGNPEDAYAHERQLDRRKQDDSGQRENLVFGVGLAANLLGIEVVKEITAMAEPSLLGRLLTIRLTDLSIEKHTVLRKPWCPACFPTPEADRVP
jgi:bacteriocin biosynthesis cyclodehydratase domain-containing protein